MDQATGYPWNDFPSVLIHASESFVKQHHAYVAAKSGDAAAATELVLDALSADVLDRMWELFSDLQPKLVSAHAEEASA